MACGFISNASTGGRLGIYLQLWFQKCDTRKISKAVINAISKVLMPDHNQNVSLIRPRNIPNKNTRTKAHTIADSNGNVTRSGRQSCNQRGIIISTDIRNGAAPLTKAITIGTQRTARP